MHDSRQPDFGGISEVCDIGISSSQPKRKSEDWAAVEEFRNTVTQNGCMANNKVSSQWQLNLQFVPAIQKIAVAAPVFNHQQC